MGAVSLQELSKIRMYQIKQVNVSKIQAHQEHSLLQLFRDDGFIVYTQ